MRRKDREVTDLMEIEAIIRRCDCVHLALMDGEKPYVVPLNFGLSRENGGFVFYMHSALEGKKLELLRQNPQGAFCLDTGHRVLEGGTGCTWSFAYESVMGQGTLALVEEPAEKRRGLECIFRQYAGERELSMPEEALNTVAVLRLTVEEITGKCRK